MTYSAPELQRVGTAQSLVLCGKLPGVRDNAELFGVDGYSDSPIPLEDSEW